MVRSLHLFSDWPNLLRFIPCLFYLTDQTCCSSLTGQTCCDSFHASFLWLAKLVAVCSLPLFSDWPNLLWFIPSLFYVTGQTCCHLYLADWLTLAWWLHLLFSRDICLTRPVYLITEHIYVTDNLYSIKHNGNENQKWFYLFCWKQTRQNVNFIGII